VEGPLHAPVKTIELKRSAESRHRGNVPQDASVVSGEGLG